MARRPGPAPLVRAHGLSLVGPAGPVFTDVDVELHPGTLTVVVGPAGSGRSALLLALSGRMRHCTGTLTLDGAHHPRRSDARRLRQRSAVARLAGLVGPEARLTVAHSIAERALIDAVRPRDAEPAFAAAESLLGVHLDRACMVERLSGYDRTALALALALLRPTDLVVLDDADADLDLADQVAVMDALSAVAASGLAVLVSTTEDGAVPDDAVRLTLPA